MEFLDKAEEERKYREEKEANAAKAGGHINYAFVLAQQVEDNIKSITAYVPPEFTDRSFRWKLLGKPYKDAARALLLCVDDEQARPDTARLLHARYIQITKMMATLYVKLTNETIISYHNLYALLLCAITALIQEEELDFCYELLSKMKADLSSRRVIIHQHKERLAVERLPEDSSTCICEDFLRNIDEKFRILDRVKIAKAQGVDCREYIKSQFPVYISQ